MKNVLLWLGYAVVYGFSVILYLLPPNSTWVEYANENIHLFLGNYAWWIVLQCEKNMSYCDTARGDSTSLYAILIIGCLIYGGLLLLLHKTVVLIFRYVNRRLYETLNMD